ncbi:MAG: RNA polymerase sigma factor [Chloroflexi bacterium]|nr:RNA polymerase sigma factor [Chloroflexota bacterium]
MYGILELPLSSSLELSLPVQSQDYDDYLIQQAVEHDRAAFASLYDRYIDRVYKHVYYKVGNQGEAEDITQETFIKAWEAIGSYRKTGAPFVAWLIAIARNLIVDRYRANKRFVPLEEGIAIKNNPDTNPEVIAEERLESIAVREAIMRLKEDKQRVVMMRYIDGFSYTEIARTMNKTEGAIRVTLFRALNELKDILKAVRGGRK